MRLLVGLGVREDLHHLRLVSLVQEDVHLPQEIRLVEDRVVSAADRLHPALGRSVVRGHHIRLRGIRVLQALEIPEDSTPSVVEQQDVEIDGQTMDSANGLSIKSAEQQAAERSYRRIVEVEALNKR